MGYFRYVGTQALIRRGLDEMVVSVNESIDQLLPKIDAATPVLTGELVGSERSVPAHIVGMTVKGEIRAGDGTAYGIIVHEKLAIHHKRGGAKYVEKPLIAHRPAHRARLAEAGRRAYG